MVISTKTEFADRFVLNNSTTVWEPYALLTSIERLLGSSFTVNWCRVRLNGYTTDIDIEMEIQKGEGEFAANLEKLEQAWRMRNGVDGYRVCLGSPYYR
jgi:hypothetical protein